MTVGPDSFRRVDRFAIDARGARCSSGSRCRCPSLAAMLVACLVPIVGFLIFQRPFLRGTGLGGAVKG